MVYQKEMESGLKISKLGLGCGRLSNGNEISEKESIATIHAALEAGVTILNTADFYGAGQSEMVIGEALKGRDRDKAFVSVKFGALMEPGGSMYGLDVRPLTVKNYLTHSLKRLKMDYVDLYQPGRIDLGIPVEETIGAVSELVRAGYVKHIGITQVDAETLKRAHAAHPIRLVEAEYSLFNRGIERTILTTARELGIDIVAFGALAHGMLAGTWTKERIEQSKGGYIPLFFEGNIERNAMLAERLAQFAAEKQATVSQLAYAWMLSKGQDIIPLIGASKPAHFQEAAECLNLSLSENDIKRIEEAIPEAEVSGASFPNMQFKNGIVVRNSPA